MSACFGASEAFDDTKIPLRCIVEGLEGWLVQVTFISGDRLFEAFELDDDHQLVDSRLAGLRRLACNDHAAFQGVERDGCQLYIFGKRGRDLIPTCSPLPNIPWPLVLRVRC